MNKRGTQQFIDKHIKLAVDNHMKGLFNADKTDGQLVILSQLALAAIHDKERHYRITEIQKAVRAGDKGQAQLLASPNWKSIVDIEEENFVRIQ